MNTNEQMRSHFVAIHDVIKKYITNEINDTSLCLRIKNIVNKALALPRRNCEVGTAEEQYARYCKYLEKDSGKSVLDLQEHYELTAKCFAHWAQMPYEEEKNGNKENTVDNQA